MMDDDPMMMAIARIRARSGQRQQTRGTMRPVTMVPALELFEEELQQRAIAELATKGIIINEIGTTPEVKARRKTAQQALRETIDRLRGETNITDWLEAHEQGIRVYPMMLRKIEGVKEFREGYGESPYRYLRGERPMRLEHFSEDTIVEMSMDVYSPRLDDINKEIAEAIELEDWPLYSPQQLYQELVDEIERNPDADWSHVAYLANQQPIFPYEQMVVQAVPRNSTRAARDAGARFHYDPGYTEWLHGEASKRHLLDETRPLPITDFDLDHNEVWEIEARLETALGKPIDQVYFGPKGYEEIPDLPDGLVAEIKAAWRERTRKGGARRHAQPDKLRPGYYKGEPDAYFMMMELRRYGWFPDADDFRAYHEKIADTQFGDTPGASYKVNEFESDVENARVDKIVKANWNKMEADARAISKAYREDGRPPLTDTDTFFFSWFEENFPGALAQMRRQLGGRDIDAAERAGVELLRVERELAFPGKKPKGMSYKEWRQSQEDWHSQFQGEAQGPAEVWWNFYNADRGVIDPKLQAIIERFETQARTVMSTPPDEAELIERALITAWFEVSHLSDVADTRVPAAVTDKIAENEQMRRKKFRMAEPVTDSPERLPELYPDDDAQRLALREFEVDDGPDKMWNFDVEGRYEDETNLDPDIYGEFEPVDDGMDPGDFELDEVDEDVAPDIGGEGASDTPDLENVELGMQVAGEESMNRGGSMQKAAMRGPGLFMRQQLEFDIIMGQTFMDLDMLSVPRYGAQFFPTKYQPPGSVPASGITRRTVADVNVADAASVAGPMSTPIDPATGGVLRDTLTGQPLAWEERTPSGQLPYGIDESLADAHGDPQRIGMDARRMREEYDRGWDREIVIKDREAIGNQPSTGFGSISKDPNMGPMASKKIQLYQEQQRDLKRMAEEIEFIGSSYLANAKYEAFEGQVAEGNALLTILFSSRPNYNMRAMSMLGVDLNQVQRAWLAFVATRDPVWLEDAHLQWALGFVKGLEVHGKNPIAQRKAIGDAIDRANLDLPPTPENLRMSVRRQIQPDAVILRTGADVRGSARQRNEYTTAAPAKGELKTELDRMYGQGRRMELHREMQGTVDYIRDDGAAKYRGVTDAPAEPWKPEPVAALPVEPSPAIKRGVKGEPVGYQRRVIAADNQYDDLDDEAIELEIDFLTGETVEVDFVLDSKTWPEAIEKLGQFEEALERGKAIYTKASEFFNAEDRDAAEAMAQTHEGGKYTRYRAEDPTSHWRNGSVTWKRRLLASVTWTRCSTTFTRYVMSGLSTSHCRVSSP